MTKQDDDDEHFWPIRIFFSDGKRQVSIRDKTLISTLLLFERKRYVEFISSKVCAEVFFHLIYECFIFIPNQKQEFENFSFSSSSFFHSRLVVLIKFWSLRRQMLLFRYDNEFTYNCMSQHLLLDFFFLLLSLHVKIVREEREEEEEKNERERSTKWFLISHRSYLGVCVCVLEKNGVSVVIVDERF